MGLYYLCVCNYLFFNYLLVWCFTKEIVPLCGVSPKLPSSDVWCFTLENSPNSQAFCGKPPAQRYQDDPRRDLQGNWESPAAIRTVRR